MKLIILDRDGVINYDSDEYIKSPEEWSPIPGSLEAIAKLTQAGYHIAVATNQAGIAKKLYDEEILTAIHEKMCAAVQSYGGEISAIFYCPHENKDNCLCRKPQPGLLWQIADHFNISIKNIPFIGDSFRDIQAGIVAGCHPILVRTGYGEKTLSDHPELIDQISVYFDLAEVVERLIIGKSI